MKKKRRAPKAAAWGTVGTLDGGDIAGRQERRRAYSPTMGRFAQIDPKEYVDGLNSYLYEVCAPIYSLDPQGTTRQIFVFDGLFESRRDSWQVPKPMEFDNVGTILAFKQVLKSDPSNETHYFQHNEGAAALALAEKLGKTPHASANFACGAYDSIFIVGWSNGGNAAARLGVALDGAGVNSAGFTTDIIPEYKDNIPVHWINYFQRDASQSGNPAHGPHVTNHDVTKEAVAYKNAQTRGKSAHFWVNRLPLVQDALKKAVEKVPYERAKPTDVISL